MLLCSTHINKISHSHQSGSLQKQLLVMQFHPARPRGNTMKNIQYWSYLHVFALLCKSLYLSIKDSKRGNHSSRMRISMRIRFSIIPFSMRLNDRLRCVPRTVTKTKSHRVDCSWFGLYLSNLIVSGPKHEGSLWNMQTPQSGWTHWLVLFVFKLCQQPLH